MRERYFGSVRYRYLKLAGSKISARSGSNNSALRHADEKRSSPRQVVSEDVSSAGRCLRTISKMQPAWIAPHARSALVMPFECDQGSRGFVHAVG